jgi:ornithine carbamoyltransferase
MIGNKKDFISLEDYTKDELLHILKTASELKQKQRNNIIFRPLEGKTLGMIFSKSSTRTRVSFETGIYQLGGMGIFLSHSDIQLGRGETVEDTGRVLDRYINGIMIRTFDHNDVMKLASCTTIPVINGLTDYNHPCQAIADLQTVYEKFNSFSNIHIAYVGDGNNVAVSLIHACKTLGISLALGCPEHYMPSQDIMDSCKNSTVSFYTEPEKAVKNAQAVYTDVWVSMGQENEKEKRLNDLKEFQVNKHLMQHTDKSCIFLHCLPTHRGEEVTAEVIDSSSSSVFEQAENRLHAQKAIMYLLMKD